MNLSLYNDKEIIQHLNMPLSYMVGTDEAGRGPLAGPLVVAGVLFDHHIHIDGIYDSKKITETKRELLEEEIKKIALAYHVEIIDTDKIAQLNIYQASKQGMIICLEEIKKKMQSNNVTVDILLTDTMKISHKELSDIHVISLVKGDQKSFHIAAASILAKVERDRIMYALHEEYPQYLWNKNKGYPTKAHRLALKEYGKTPHHREGFKLFG